MLHKHANMSGVCLCGVMLRVCVCGHECLSKVKSDAVDPSTVDGHARRRCEEDVCPEEVASTCVCSVLGDV